MGIICCIGNNKCNESNYNVPDYNNNKKFYSNENSNENLNNESFNSEQKLIINKIDNINKSNKEIYNFIINSDFYLLLLKDINPNFIIKKLCENKNNSDLIEIINMIVDFIINFDINKNKNNNNNIK